MVLKLNLSQNHLMQWFLDFVSTDHLKGLLNTNCWAYLPESVVERRICIYQKFSWFIMPVVCGLTFEILV